MHVIDFTPQGTVQAMHNDKFDLSFLGSQSITRASEIQFDAATQRWAIWLPKPWPHVGGEYFVVPDGKGFHTYDGARQIEVKWLNACRLEGVKPMSTEGLAALKFLRDTHSPDL